MRSLKDYVDSVAVGMGRFLSDDELTALASELAASKKYKEILSQLELRIKELD